MTLASTSGVLGSMPNSLAHVIGSVSHRRLQFCLRGSESIHTAVSRRLAQQDHRRRWRQLWAYCGLALKTSTSGEYRIVEGQLKRSKKFLAIRGLNQNHNHDLKNIFKGAATRAAAVPGPFQEFHAGLVARGMKPTMARLTLARKIAAITLIVWKKGVHFDAEYLKQQAA